VINEKILNLSFINVLALKTYEAMYFILDYEKGLYILNDSTMVLNINISRSFAFDYYDKTLLIMAKTSIK